MGGSVKLGGSSDSSSPVDEVKTTTPFFADRSSLANLSTSGFAVHSPAARDHIAGEAGVEEEQRLAQNIGDELL